MKGNLTLDLLTHLATTYIEVDSKDQIDNCAMYKMILEEYVRLLHQEMMLNSAQIDQKTSIFQEEYDSMRQNVEYCLQRMLEKERFYSHVLGHDNYIASLINVLSMDIFI